MIHNKLAGAPKVAHPVLNGWPQAKLWQPQSEIIMKKDRKGPELDSSEPLGIIISRGDRTEPTPVFSAYIWGPVPDEPADSAHRAA